MVRSGRPRRYLPTGLPPWQTVYWYFSRRTRPTPGSLHLQLTEMITISSTWR
ncbi:hypothetical protein [Nonomuraea roseola]|uniref:Uncharacterized protein n=1 Tax=Nonomuraea roseola TaxID=46179 RepID=A0ABV5QDE9_9ACTN